MKSITVFCGSSPGHSEIFLENASSLGRTLAEQNIDLIYGGAKIGLMGAVADGALESGGRVVGVLPKFLSVKELEHKGLTELILVDTMHERKTKMNELCDGVIALPGGFGTMEELFEMLTWSQLGIHSKPIGVLNVNGFYDSLATFVETMVSNGFLKEANQKMLLISDNADELLNKMAKYEPKAVVKWDTN